MLDLLVRLMKFQFYLLVTLLLIAAQDSPPVAISSPRDGDVLRGEVTITGTTDILNFASSQLDFAYASSPADTWFALQTSSQPVVDSPLALWNTTLISDGDYILRLRVNLSDGTFVDVTVPVTIQNDVSFMTSTPTPTSTPESITVQFPTPFLVASSPTPTKTSRPTPTALPPNPVSLSQINIFTSLGRGALVIIGLFALSGLFLRLRRY
jgi:hypothetical protein